MTNRNQQLITIPNSKHVLEESFRVRELPTLSKSIQCFTSLEFCVLPSLIGWRNWFLARQETTHCTIDTNIGESFSSITVIPLGTFLRVTQGSKMWISNLYGEVVAPHLFLHVGSAWSTFLFKNLLLHPSDLH